MVDMLVINTNDIDSINYRIKFLIGNTLILTKESLNSSYVSDIVYIPISSEYFIN